MPTLYASGQREMQEIVDKEHEFINKEHMDEEIVKLIKKQVTDFSEDYRENRIYWWDTPEEFFKREKTILNSLYNVHNKIIKKYIEEHNDTLNLDLYFKMFKSVHYKNCLEIITFIISRKNISSRLTDEQILELYKHYPRECRDNWYFQGVKERIKNLFLEEKYPEKLNKEEEVLIYLNTLRYDANYSFLSLEDVYYNLKLTSEELKNIINKYDFEYINREDIHHFWNMLSYRKKIITPEIKESLYNKVMNSNSLLKLIWRKSNGSECQWFYSYDIFTKKQLDKLCKKLYDIVSDKNLYKVNSRHSCNNFKRDFVEGFANSWKSPTKNSQKQVILDRMINDLIEQQDYAEESRLNMKNIYNLSKDINWTIGKAESKKLLNALKNNYLFFETILDVRYSNCSYEFDFIKNKIITHMDSLELLNIIQMNINNITEERAFRVFDIVTNIIGTEKNPEKLEKVSSEILNHIFEISKEVLDTHKFTPYTRNITIYKFLTNDSFKYLTKENKKKILNFCVHSNEACKEITDLINSGNITGNDLINMWNFDLKNTEFHCGIIDTAFTKYGIDEINEEFITLINNYLQEHKLDYVRFVRKRRYRDWADFEIDFICEVENQYSIFDYLNNRSRFTEEQWDKIFKHFYHMDTNPFIPFNSYLFRFYNEFDRNYNSMIKETKYQDGDLINEKDSNKIEKVLKKVKKKAEKAELDDLNDELPF